MKDGQHVYYTLQHRRTHESPWLKPKCSLLPIKNFNEEWIFSSWDIFGGIAEPWHGKGNDYHPKHKEAYDETHSVWVNTNCHGWWSLKYAAKGLRRIQKADTKGKFDSYDGYRHHNQAIRHEFRLVKITVSQETKII